MYGKSLKGDFRPSLSNIPGKYNIALDNGGQATVMEDSNDLSAHAVSFGGNDVKFRISLGGVGEKKDWVSW